MDDRNDLRLTDPGDERLVPLMRELYAPPADDSYWEGLETRVLSLIASNRLGLVRLQSNLWSVLERWATPGLAAAGLLFIAAGLFLARPDGDELRTAYEEVITEPAAVEELPGAVHVVTAPRDGSSQREAVFRYVLSH
ncbi:MAG TPA: hypothetical protein VJZ25_02385 [Gemmatimonadaceae bacterium]|nr:hypothetical protein [Gemmatimonadaceae bacterium]